MANNNYSFRRLTEPFVCSVDTTPQRFDFPAGFFLPGGAGSGCSSFYVVNPNNFWIRLKGSGNAAVPTSGTGYTAVTETTGWLFPPGFTGVFSSQYPLYLSWMSVTYQGLPAGAGEVNISYGGGA